MHDFRYVSKKEAAPVKAELLEIIHEVQDIVRDDFTFQYTFIGSSSRNMITEDIKSNIGYDFDVNLEVNDDEENFSAEQIKLKLKQAFDSVAWRYGYDHCEDSTRVLTLKVKDREHSRILHSCDFAIVYNCSNGNQQYIRHNKEQGTYTWEYQPKGFIYLPEKIDWLKENRLWGDLLEYYIIKKNYNTNPDKHSRSLFAESINELCRKHGFESHNK